MKLGQYLQDTGIPTARFAKRCGLTYPQIRHILLGNCPTLESALRIQKYTNGEIMPKDLLSQNILDEIYGQSDTTTPS